MYHLSVFTILWQIMCRGRGSWPVCTVHKTSSAVYVTYFLHISNNASASLLDSDLASVHLAGHVSGCWWHPLYSPLPHSHWALRTWSWELLNWHWPLALEREKTLKLHLQQTHGKHLTFWRKKDLTFTFLGRCWCWIWRWFFRHFICLLLGRFLH